MDPNSQGKWCKWYNADQHIKELEETNRQLFYELNEAQKVVDRLHKELSYIMASIRAKHGFDRNASHTADEYVCTCGKQDCSGE